MMMPMCTYVYITTNQPDANPNPNPTTNQHAICPNSTWLVTSRLDTTRHVRLVERVETSVSNRAVRQARLSQNAWVRHVERVVSRRDMTSQVEFGL